MVGLDYSRLARLRLGQANPTALDRQNLENSYSTIGLLSS